jgi:hypothetical protein
MTDRQLVALMAAILANNANMKYDRVEDVVQDARLLLEEVDKKA